MQYLESSCWVDGKLRCQTLKNIHTLEPLRSLSFCKLARIFQSVWRSNYAFFIQVLSRRCRHKIWCDLNLIEKELKFQNTRDTAVLSLFY